VGGLRQNPHLPPHGVGDPLLDPAVVITLLNLTAT
jgi:hypothetical protein